MGCRVWNDRENQLAGLYDSCTDWCFGPVFIGADAADHAEAFIEFCRKDPRLLDDKELEKLYCDYREAGFELCCACDQMQRDVINNLCPACRIEEEELHGQT